MPEWSYPNIFYCAIKLSSRLYSVSREFPRQLETIIDYVSEHLEVTRGKRIPIFFHPRAYEGEAFMGTIEDFGSKVDIFYDLDRNKCWRRFTLTKELCHILYEFPNNQHLASTPEQIASLITQILAGLASSNLGKNHAADSEQATVLMAIEILLPHRERANVNKMLAEGGDTLTVAKHYLLPEQMVSLYLDSNYSSFMKKVLESYMKDQNL
jgi:hypothetical protein